MPDTENPTTVVPDLGFVVVNNPTCLISRYEPVAARIFGGGTSSVLPSGVGIGNLPEGAVLVSCGEPGTSTNLR